MNIKAHKRFLVNEEVLLIEGIRNHSNTYILWYEEVAKNNETIPGYFILQYCSIIKKL